MWNLSHEADRFREWATQFPLHERNGEWECSYPHWNDLNAAFLGFISDQPIDNWTPNDVKNVLYVIARDNETEFLSGSVAHHGTDCLLRLAEAATSSAETDAKWQLAEQLGRLEDAPNRREELLLVFARDESEYVRRRSLSGLARIGSPATEQIALEAWETPNESQQWSRMMALWALYQVGSPHLGRLVSEAREQGEHLANYAAKIAAGEIER